MMRWMECLARVSAGAVMMVVVFASGVVEAREHIHVVGSSTVFPFVAMAAEQFGGDGDFRAPIVESTGTGGGMKLFCDGVGNKFPDMTNASRGIKESEVKLCTDHGVKEITEVVLGFDGIVLASDKSQKIMDISIADLFNALAYKVEVDGKLVPNPYITWKDVNSELPDQKIEVYGPPPTSGTRDAFVEIVMEKGCKAYPAFKVAHPEKKKRKKICHMLREDGGFVEAGENDNLIVQKLKSNTSALGIFGYSFLEQNAASVHAHVIDSVPASFDNIVDGSYPVARSLFVYVKNAHLNKTKGLQEFIEELTSEDALAYDGYLTETGLIPLPPEQQEQMRQTVAGLR